MKHHLQQLVSEALARLDREDVLALPPDFTPGIERTRDRTHGDFACNAAMVLARQTGRPPRELAQQLVGRIAASGLIDKVEIAGPGFINFFLTPAAYHTVVRSVLEQEQQFGRSTIGNGQRVLLEFVSANPTGPLHVGHGRGAAYGATLANLLDAAGYAVEREYYVNDAGRQMDILACSVWLRYLELHGTELPFPENAYRGAYVRDIARQLRTDHGDRFERTGLTLPAAGDDSEQFLDELIVTAKSLLGQADYLHIFNFGMQSILDDIRIDLAEFGVEFDRWFPESSLVLAGNIDQAIACLQENGHLYEADGALWFRATVFGDEKDRVVVRENGQKTYFAADIAYHLDKYARGYDHIIDIWGADHHGYAPRVRAAIQASGQDPNRMAVLFVQFATLYRGDERLPMSTRAGEFVTLRELREEVGRDAARFFYIMRRSDQHLEFDLELAKSQSNDNSVFYIQYAHARICSVLRQMEERGLSHDNAQGLAQLAQLNTPEEDHLLVTLSRYPEIIELAALSREPHQLAYYLRELANEFHVYYNSHQFLVEQHDLRNARLCLSLAVRQVLANGLGLLGVSAPESM